ncbi:MAG TPA: ribonuclease G [Burkholderiales bacterium]|nr:ribonuclease G [Burkholderiales bacterium]
MDEEILVNVTPQETRVAVAGSGVVQELLIERAASRGFVGNIYMGRVARVLPGMQSAFVEIGLERAAFLHVGDILEDKRLARPIEKVLAEGQPLLVQVVKDPIGSKGARLSTQISIAGRLLVYLPASSAEGQPHIGISQRIEDEDGRAALRERVKELVPPEEKGGFIVRTLAESAAEEELRADLAYLRNLWEVIKERSLGAAPPQLVYQDLSLAQRVLRDMVNPGTSRVVVDSRETWQSLAAFAERYMSQVRSRIEHYTGERPLFELYDVEAEIERALARRVELKSGGTLVIDQTEAMTTIDVNTGGFVGSRSFDDTVFKTNLEAAQAIARQLRLRNLGGIIVIDFIDMQNAEHRAAVLEEFRRALSRDRTRMTVNGFTALGLVEMTRKRTRESLAHVLCEPCPTCAGRGAVKTAHTVCYEILREILREARAFQAKEFRVVASQPVIDLFLEEQSPALAMLSDFIGKPISMHVESGYTQEQFDIVLM